MHNYFIFLNSSNQSPCSSVFTNIKQIEVIFEGQGHLKVKIIVEPRSNQSLKRSVPKCI